PRGHQAGPSGLRLHPRLAPLLSGCVRPAALRLSGLFPTGGRSDRLRQHSVEAEVCVIGGGAAGASFALRLARLGHRVIPLERSAFPRPHVGEVLTPGIWPLLDALGTAGAVRSAPFLPVAEARVRWAGRAALRIPASAGA